MKDDVLKGTKQCEFCKNEFEWLINPKLKSGSVFGKWADHIKNVKKCTPLRYGYCIELACPYCNKRNYIEIKISEENING